MDSRILECLEGSSYRMHNVCILAHIDHGKTTFADGLLATNNLLARQQIGKIRFMDSRSDEQERGITMKASSILLLLERATKSIVNLIDTPGHSDLVHEAAVAASLSDACFILVDLVDGIAAQTRTALLHAKCFNLRPILVLNKFDRLFREKNVKEYFEFYLAIEEIISEANQIFGGEAEKYFSMNDNNVVFGSATDNWMCSIGHFERFLLKNDFKFISEEKLHKLWSLEEYYVSPKLKSISQEKIKNHPQLSIQVLFDTIASFYNLEELPSTTVLKIYRKIMKDIDKDTDDETLLKKFAIKEALPRLRKLLLETWMPLGFNCLEIISGEFNSDIEYFNKSDNLVDFCTIDEIQTLDFDNSNLKYIQIAKLFLLSDSIVGLCKYLGNSQKSHEPLSEDDKLFLGDQSVEFVDICLINGTRLVPIKPNLIKPDQIFAIRFKSFEKNTKPKQSWESIKDFPTKTGSVLVNKPTNKIFKPCKNEKLSMNLSPVFKVIFLPKKDFLGKQNDEDSSSIYQLLFKILVLSDHMLKVVLKPNGFWELYFLGRLHYEKFTTDFRMTLLTIIDVHKGALGINSLDDIEITDLEFQNLNLIQLKGELLIAFKETISENFFMFHGKGLKVTRDIHTSTESSLTLAPIYIPNDIDNHLKKSSEIKTNDVARLLLINKWIINQFKENTSDQIHLLFSYKGNHLFGSRSDVDSLLLNYLKIGFKMAVESGGPLCEEPLIGANFLIQIPTNCSNLDFQFALSFNEAISQFMAQNSNWYRLVIPMYHASASVSAESPSYQIVCELIRRFDGKILDVEETSVQFQLPVTESERFIELIRKRCHGHVDVHFSFESEEEDSRNWKIMDFVSEERKHLLEGIEGQSDNEVKQKNTKKKGGKQRDKDNTEEKEESLENCEIVEILLEDDLEDLEDLLEMYGNMEKSRIKPLVGQMRNHKGLFEQHTFELFSGEKQEKNATK